MTVHNASTFNAYEIRQELNRRNAFDFKEDDVVNFRTLLKRLMIELVKDEEQNAIIKEHNNKLKIETSMEKSKRIREEKKMEALERSRQRQADPNYFKNISEKNSNKNVKEDDVAAPQPQPEDDVEEDQSVGVSDDPFLTFVPKGRPKIFIR